MVFSSLTFLFLFLPLLYIFIFVSAKQSWRNAVLTVFSLVFYAWGEPVWILAMLFSTAVNYGCALLIDRAGRTGLRKLFLTVGVLASICFLFYFKYAAFLLNTVTGLFGISYTMKDPGLPIGISFYTFQILTYTVDVYRRNAKVQRNPLRLLLYISCFPQLIAGPIVRYEDISAQLGKREFSADRVARGFRRFLFGLGKKVLIANQMGCFADTVFGYDPAAVGMGSAWLGALCYSLQIFFDFSGYSDMAIGLGCVFGFDFLENFNYPYISGSIQEFWRRWHISLSTWFREYVYIPLGGNRKGNARTTVNKLIVFFLTGLWHGANFTFIVWGMLHGLCQMLETYQIIPTKKKWFRPLGHVYTLLVVVLAFVLFRADTLTQGFRLIGRMFCFSAGDAAVNAEILSGASLMFVIAFFFALLLSMPVFPMLRKKASAGKLCAVYEHGSYLISLVIFGLSILSLVSGSYNPFIYFRF
jgi:alginate O-acetyltransferase complex protein AlgI